MMTHHLLMSHEFSEVVVISPIVLPYPVRLLSSVNKSSDTDFELHHLASRTSNIFQVYESSSSLPSLSRRIPAQPPMKSETSESLSLDVAASERRRTRRTGMNEKKKNLKKVDEMSRGKRYCR